MGQVIKQHSRVERVLAVAAAVLVAGCLLAAMILASNSPTVGTHEGFLYAVILVPWAVVGLLLVFRVPGNRIAWLCIAFAASWSVGAPVEVATELALAGETIPGIEYFYALAYPLWVPGVATVGFILLLFPEGRLPSPKWKPLAVTMGVVSFLLVLTGIVWPGNYSGEVVWDNPFGIDALAPLTTASYALTPILALCLLGSGAAVVVRYRRSVGVERAQLRWLAAAGIVSALGYLAWLVLGLLGIAIAPQIFWITIPVAVWFSVSRHRLYDLDSLLSRTVGYALVVGLLGCVYAAAVYLLGRVAPLDNDLAVAMSTLGAAALFNPVRRRVLRWVERRFNRTRYDPEAVTDRLTTILRTTHDPDQVADAWHDVTVEALHPSAAGIWTRPRRRIDEI